MVLLTREELQALRSRESDKSIKNNIVVQEDIKFSGEMRGGYLHADTLKKAEESKLYDEEQMNLLKSTAKSKKESDVIKHRGVEEKLEKDLNFKSKSYSKNCRIIHKYQNPALIPKKK